MIMDKYLEFNHVNKYGVIFLKYNTTNTILTCSDLHFVFDYCRPLNIIIDNLYFFGYNYNYL